MQLLQRQIDFPHDSVRLDKDFDYPLVVADVIPAEFAALAVSQSFLRRVVSDDVEVPGHVGRARETFVALIQTSPPSCLGWSNTFDPTLEQ